MFDKRTLETKFKEKQQLLTTAAYHDIIFRRLQPLAVPFVLHAMFSENMIKKKTARQYDQMIYSETDQILSASITAQ